MSDKMNDDEKAESGFDEKIINRPDVSISKRINQFIAIHFATHLRRFKTIDRAWWTFCCFGLWCQSCAGFNLNLKLGKNMS